MLSLTLRTLTRPTVWVGNPAAPLFYEPYRPAPVSDLEVCPSYDTWPFGFGGDYDSSYFNGTPPTSESAWARYQSRNVHHATGLSDNWSGDMGCEALVMGFAHRDRMRAWFAWLERAHGGLPPSHTADYVKGVGHNASDMLAWPTTLFRLFFESPAANLTLGSHGLKKHDLSYEYDLVKWNTSDVALNAFHGQQPAAPDGSDLDFTAAAPPSATNTGVSNDADTADGTDDGTPSPSGDEGLTSASADEGLASANASNSTIMVGASACLGMPLASWVALFIGSASAVGFALLGSAPDQ